MLFILLAVFRLGWISHFLSKAVITGFLFGAAIDVVVGELPKLSGTDASGENVWREFASWLDTIGDFHGPTFVVGMVALVGILVLRFTVPKVPGALALVVGGLIASKALDLAGRDIAMVGDVPRGFPRPSVPGGDLIWDNAATIATAAFALLLIGFSQTAGDARMFAGRHQYRIDVEPGIGRPGYVQPRCRAVPGHAGVDQPVREFVERCFRRPHPVASIVTGVMVVLTMLILAPLFSDLPKAVLGVLIIDAVVFGMMDVPEMRRLWSVKRFDFWIAVAAILAVLSFGVLGGVIIGMVLSVGWLIYVSSHPNMPELGRQPGSTAFRPLADFPDGETFPGLLVIAFQRRVVVRDCRGVRGQLRTAVQSERDPITSVVIDFGGVNFVDSQGSAALAKISRATATAGVALRLVRVKADVVSVLRADGVVDLIGEDHFHANIDEAMAVELAPPL